MPCGKLWRAGANQITQINVYQDISLEGNDLPAANDTRYSIPKKDEWIIVISSKLYTLGACDYEESKGVIRFTVTARVVTEARENFGEKTAWAEFCWPGILLKSISTLRIKANS